MCCKGWIIFLWCTTLFFLSVRSQSTRIETPGTSYIFRNIDNTSGLNSNEVYGLTQDRKGYMWIATEKGLERYDGTRFVDCFKNAGKEGSLIVSSLFPDDAHGKVLYSQPDNRLRQWSYVTNTSSDAAIGQAPEKKYVDGKGVRWTISEYWTDSNRGFVRIQQAGATTDRDAPFLKDRIGRKTWIVDQAEGLLLLDDDKGCIYSEGYNPAGNPLLAQLRHLPASIRKIMADTHGNIWLISWSQNFYRYNVRSQKLSTYSLASVLEQEGNAGTLPGWVSDIFEDDHGALWLSSAKAGLLQYDFEANRFAVFLRQPNNNLGLQYNYQINAIFQDREENIWLATDKGISIFNPYRQYFTALNNQDSSRPSMALNEISGALVTARNELWVGTWGGGINVYDKALHLKKHFISVSFKLPDFQLII